MKFLTASLTHPGMVRDANEDAIAVFEGETIWIVADGMGGHSSGQLASRMAVQYAADFMLRWRLQPDFVWPFDVDSGTPYSAASLVNALRVANVRIYNRAQVDESCESMGTTAVMLHYDEDGQMVIAHVGDSRCYRLREGELQQLTEDHSLAREMSRIMDVTEADAQAHVGSHIILRALGTEDDVEVDVQRQRPMLGDVYLLCSDGLTDVVDDATLARMMSTTVNDPDSTAQALVQAANDGGGHDNISVVLVCVVPDGPSKSDEDTATDIEGVVP